MLLNKKIIVVMPAYNAEKTLAQTYAEIPHNIVDEVILVDDKSRDDTAVRAAELGIHTIIHTENLGYGGNQKTCYRAALSKGADIVVMVHPDYQYSPRLITALAAMIASNHYDIALGSRILGGTARRGGMPLYKYVANRALTLLQNICFRAKLSEYHTGLRAFSSDVLRTLRLEENSDDFVFDNQMLAQALYENYRIGEISCPTRYFEDASSIRFQQATHYGLGVLLTTAQYLLHKLGWREFAIFSRSGRCLEVENTAHTAGS